MNTPASRDERRAALRSLRFWLRRLMQQLAAEHEKRAAELRRLAK